jgi:serine/threonine protein kinase
MGNGVGSMVWRRIWPVNVHAPLLYCAPDAPSRSSGKTKIPSTIGSGGFGTVLRRGHVDRQEGRFRAAAQAVGASTSGELLQELRLLASLDHPNIVTILTAEKQENVFFIVMVKAQKVA